MSNNIKDVMINIRRSYRLLTVYHRRMLDIVKSFSELIEMHNFESSFYYDGLHGVLGSNSSILSEPRRFLPIQSAFLFSSGEKPGAGQWLLEISHAGDTGFDELEEKQVRHLNDFVISPEDAETYFWLGALIVRKGSTKSWAALWNNCYYPSDEGSEKYGEVKEVGEGLNVWSGESLGCDVDFFIWELPIDRCVDEASLKKTANKFKEMVQKWRKT